MADHSPQLPIGSIAPLDSDLEIMTTAEVAAFLRITERTVTNLAKRGVIPGRQFGTLWRFSRHAIVAVMYDPENAQALSERHLGTGGNIIGSSVVHTFHHARRSAPAGADRHEGAVPLKVKGFKSGPTSSRDVQ
jgi:excisionase family DNA binding protein